MNILGRKIKLRAIEEEDSSLLLNMINDSDMERITMGWSFPISKVQQTKWNISANENMLDKRFVISTTDNNAIGLCFLENIDWKNRVAWQGLKLVNDNNIRGKGYGLDTVMAIMRYAFEELQLNKLETEILECNHASLNLYINKCSWKKEGLRRQSYYTKGQYYNSIMISILNTEYRSFIVDNKYWEGME